ncbi:hypothetical protein GCM10009837_27270 [Streptomyces durmitorensis]
MHLLRQPGGEGAHEPLGRDPAREPLGGELFEGGALGRRERQPVVGRPEPGERVVRLRWMAMASASACMNSCDRAGNGSGFR